ncbi:type II secretion system protein N [Xenophilus sp. Marseille-Q4582]|uniref:type II secretion system protein N n=1 Tax=Xenophilus sp. Marseille-Q4582 TaxID=2866600 RepID=UPI001CE4652A|nr:type II secretion system protein N [Xenophilus sp. Marseille-Q4582]
MKPRRTPLPGRRAARGGAEAPARAPWGWALGGAVLGILLATLLWAPARWLAAGLQQASGGRVQLINARGTVWQGTAGLVLASGAPGGEAMALPGRLGWQLRPRLDGLRGRLDLPCCAPAPVGFALQRGADGGMQLAWQDAATQWPATLLTGLGAPWNTLKPEGTLTLRTQGFVLGFQTDRLAIQGQATLDATDMSSSLSTLRPMGSYRLALAGGAAPSLLLTTTGGALQLAGSGLWTGRSMRFSGEASAAAGSEDALSNLLNIIGRRDGARSIINLS